MSELQSKPNGTITKRNGLEVRKYNQLEFDIFYMRKGFGNEYSRQIYLTSPKTRITQALYDIETGRIKMIDGILVDTRAGLEKRSYGNRKQPKKFNLFLTISNLLYMRSYCVKQKKQTDCVPGSEQYVKVEL